MLNAEFLGNARRSHYCGDLRKENEGQTVTVCGWVQRQRDLGQLIFIDLRDRTGIVQLAFDDNTDREVFDKAFQARSEYVLAVTGVVRVRSAINKDIPTGEIEIFVTDLRILGKKRIILSGMSMGTTTVLLAAGAGLPENVVGITADCGFTCPAEIIGRVMGFMHVPPRIVLPILNLLFKHVAGFDAYAHSTVDAMKKNNIPVLFKR